jgi:lipopolysaccharide/colanic/teichoic acid biosynthesis glycosyltransferase
LSYAIGKRALDLVIAISALVILLPFLPALMLLLRLTGEGEVFFRQRRIGYRNRPFELWKFVTMLKDSPNSGVITASDDPRILPIGKWLRTTKINELPQLLNVIWGDMSIVGPRPLAEETFEPYPDDVKKIVYESKPGLTGIGSLVFRSEENILALSEKNPEACYREDIAPIKGALEVWYQQHKSFLVDLKIILLTAITIIWPENRLYQRWFRDLTVIAGPPPTGCGDMLMAKGD